MALVLERHIAQHDGIRGGKPHIVNTRITVSDIVIMHFRQGHSLEEIAVNYNLLLAAVYAAVAYYYDHKQAVDAEIESDQVFYETMKHQAGSVLRDKLQSSDDE